jgi:hypothetical protein
MTTIWNRFFKFLLVFKICFLMQYECMMSCSMSALHVPHQKKKFAKYLWCTHSQWQITLITVVSPSDMTFTNVFSVPAEKHNRYMTYITIYPQVVPMCLTLHGQRYICYENVFTS